VPETKIEWTDFTFNPWVGCQKVSRGCDFCYAEAFADRRFHLVEWGPHGKRMRTSAATWNTPQRWNARALNDGVRYRVFCASLADWLDNKVPPAWRSELCSLIEETPALDWLLLTKRPENLHRLVPIWCDVGIPGNVWLGITAEDQEHFEHRWDIWQSIDARVRFISYEPALGPLSVRAWACMPEWIICGGESGPQAREMNPDWARALRDECAELGIAYFMKQMTRKRPIPADLLVRQFPS
jgi:protein gp37